MNKTTQDQEILQALKEQGYIEPMQALNEYGVYRLSACICRLRKQGHNITTRRVKKQFRFRKGSFARYYLDEVGK